MEDKIEVGEYIRIRKSGIRKLIKRDVDGHIILDIVHKGYNFLTRVEEIEDIVISSNKISDLIIAGDYINGHRVLSMYYEENREKYFNVEGVIKPISEQDIEDVVTYEEFKAIRYEV